MKFKQIGATNTKLCVPVVTLSTQGKVTLFEQLKSGFERTINWIRYNSRRKNKLKTHIMII